jgi:hypothetical protein
MVEIQTQSIAVGTVFPYSQAFSEPDLNQYLSEHDYESTERDQQGINITAEGIGIGPNPIYATKDTLQVLLNQESNIEGLPDSSFITIKDASDADADLVLSEVETLWKEYNDIDFDSESKFTEVTLQGRIKIDPQSHQITNLLKTNLLSQLKNITNADSKGTAVTFTSDQNKNVGGWYRLQFNSESIGNPRLWAFKIVRRYDTYKSVEIDNLIDNIKTLTENTVTN